MKILFVDSTHPQLKTLLQEAGFETFEPQLKTKEEYLDIVADYEGIIIRSKFKIDASFFDAAKKLRFIGRVGAGMENIDLAAAEKHGVTCFNSPEGNRDAVGEHALGMLLVLQNNLIRAHSEVQQGIWRREANRGTELKGKTMGIIGFGNMGSAFAQKLRGFEMDILSYDKYKIDYVPDYVQEVQLAEFFQKCDFVSMHVPLADDTFYMCDEQFFNAFAKPVTFINTARGKVLKTSALVSAMKSGKVIGACLDVLEYEAVSFENLHKSDLPADFQYLSTSERVVLSPHIGGWTHESNVKLSTFIAKKIIKAFSK